MQGTKEALDKQGSAGTHSSKQRVSIAIKKRSSEFSRRQLLFQGSNSLMAEIVLLTECKLIHFGFSEFPFSFSLEWWPNSVDWVRITSLGKAPTCSHWQYLKCSSSSLIHTHSHFPTLASLCQPLYSLSKWFIPFASEKFSRQNFGKIIDPFSFPYKWVCSINCTVILPNPYFKFNCFYIPPVGDH